MGELEEAGRGPDGPGVYICFPVSRCFLQEKSFDHNDGTCRHCQLAGLWLAPQIEGVSLSIFHGRGPICCHPLLCCTARSVSACISPWHGPAFQLAISGPKLTGVVTKRIWGLVLRAQAEGIIQCPPMGLSLVEPLIFIFILWVEKRREV